MKKAKVRNRIALRGFQLWAAPMFFLGAVASADAQPANTVQVKNLQSRPCQTIFRRFKKKSGGFFFFLTPPGFFFPTPRRTQLLIFSYKNYHKTNAKQW